MKKAMSLLLCMLSLVSTVALGMFELTQDNKRLNDIEINQNATKFYIQSENTTRTPEEELSEFQKLAENYQATFIRTDDVFEKNRQVVYKSGVFASNYFKESSFKLARGKLPINNQEFLATYATNKPHQSGTLFDLGKDLPLVISSLENFYQKNTQGVAGSYTLIVASDKKEIVLQQLSDFFGIPKETLLEELYGHYYGAGTIYLLSIVLGAILLAIFCLMNAFYPVSRFKEIGVLKLQGYKNFDSWKQLNKGLFTAPFILYFLLFIPQKLLVKESDWGYFLKYTLLQLLISAVCMLFSLLMLILIQKVKLSSLLKNYFNFRFSLYFSYLLKFVVFIGLILTIPSMAKEFQTLSDDLSLKSAYEQEKNQLTLSKLIYVGNEFRDKLNGGHEFLDKLISFYQELEKTADAKYVQTNSLTPFKRNFEENPENVTFAASEHYDFMTVNQNYLHSLNINLGADLQEIFQNENIVYLVPESLKKDEKKIELLVRDDALLYYEEGKFTFNTVPVQLLFYPNNQNKIFSENTQMVHQNNGFVQNPIFHCLSDKFATYRSVWIDQGALSNPLRITDTKEHRQAIQEAILHNHLEQNQIQFQNVLSSGFAKELSVSQSSVAVWVSIMILAILVSILSSYYIVLIILTSKKKQIVVSKILGYSLLERYKNEVFFFTAIYIFGLAEIFILDRQILSLLSYLVLVGLDSLIIYLLVRNREGKSLSATLKGEE